MTFAAGQRIQSSDYNTMSNNLASVWGQGTGNKGWGQNVSPIGPVTSALQVTATQWSSLLQTTNSALAHIGSPLISTAGVTAGSPILYIAALDTGVNTVLSAESGYSPLSRTDGAANNAVYTGAWGNTGNRGLLFTHTVTFSSGNAARYFFNAGGRLALSFSRTGGSATQRNTEWSSLATQCGQWRYSAVRVQRQGGSGTATIYPSTGYWNTNTSASTQITQYDDGYLSGYSAYTTNYIAMYASLSGTSLNGGRPTVTLQTFWINTWSNVNQQEVDGTTTSLVIQSPALTYISNTWGTPTVTSSAVLY